MVLKIEYPPQGRRQFLTARSEMLDAFDRAREKAKVHSVEVLHGRVAEAEFRRWLAGFLPKKYAVTSGYVVSIGVPSNQKAVHFDVIIYDGLNAPVLWIEDSPDVSDGGRSRAIPVEHVFAILEVKSRLTPSNVIAAIEHLRELSPLMARLDTAGERYPMYLPPTFCCGTVFFELAESDARSMKTLENLAGGLAGLRHFFGGIVLRGEGHVEPLSAHVEFIRLGLETVPFPVSSSLLDGAVFGRPVEVVKNVRVVTTLTWAEDYFSRFAFDLLALMSGTFEFGRLSSFYGLGSSLHERVSK